MYILNIIKLWNRRVVLSMCKKNSWTRDGVDCCRPESAFLETISYFPMVYWMIGSIEK